MTHRNEFAWMLIAVAVTACIALFINLQTGFYALLFAAVAWWAWMNAEESLLFFILLAPLLPMFKVTQTLGNFTLVKDVIIGTLFFKQFLLPLVTQRLPYRRNIFLLPGLMLLGWVSISTLQADSLTLGILRARDIVLYMMLYMAVLYLPASKEIILERAKWFLVGLGGLLMLALYQWFFAPDGAVLRFDPARSIWIPRISSTFAHPTVFGEYLNLAVAFFTAIFIVIKKQSRWLAALGVLILLPFIYLTYSRGVWLGLLFCWGAMAASLLIHRLHIGTLSRTVWVRVAGSLVVFILILSAITAFTPVGTFVRSAVDPTYPSNQIRLQFVNRLIASTSDTQALFGKGLGDIVQQVINTTVDITGEDVASGDSRSVQLSKDSTLVDNQHLKTFIEMGLVGLLLYFWVYVTIIKGSFTLSQNTQYGMGQIIGFTCIGFVAAFVVQGLFVDIWDVFPTNALFWIVAALVSVSLVPVPEENNY